MAALCGVLLINALSDKPHLWLLYVVAALTASVDGLQRPALEAMVPRLVQPAELPATMAARSRPELLGTYLVDINAMFFGMPQALYPFLALQLGGPKVLGLLYAAPAVGSLVATLGSGWTGRVHRHGLMVIIAAGLWGVGIVGAGLSTMLWLTLLCLAFAGASDMISGIFRSIIWSQTIPDHLRGRLAGIEMLSYTPGRCWASCVRGRWPGPGWGWAGRSGWAACCAWPARWPWP